MTDLLAALGLVLVIEGLLLAAFPGRVREVLEMMRASPDQALRTIGIASALAGLVVVWLVRG